jgi:hypothetical protein
LAVKRIAAATAGLMLAFGAVPADAASVLTTISGTVVSGYDQTGLFGPVGGALAGATFTVRYTTQLGMPGAVSYDSATQNFTIGGAYYALPSPTSAVFSINGFDQVITGAYRSWAYATNDEPSLPPLYGELYHEAYDYAFSDTGYTEGRVWTDVFNPSSGSAIPSDYRTAGTYLLQPGDAPSGHFDFLVKDYELEGFLVQSYGELTFHSVTVTSVPEPATWTLSILGLALAGAFLRGRRETPAAA